MACRIRSFLRSGAPATTVGVGHGSDLTAVMPPLDFVTEASVTIPTGEASSVARSATWR